MTRRRLLPAGPVLAALLVMTACTTGGGLRVEGSKPPVTVTVAPPASKPTPSVTSKPAPSVTPKTLRTPPRTLRGRVVGLPAVRKTLLADARLDANARSVLANCDVVQRCLRLGVRADVMHTGTPQQVVTVNTLDGLIFGGFLLALESAGPRLVWSLSADRLKIYPSRQGDLVVESKVFGPSDRVCCPSGSKVEVYRWNGQQMTKLSEQYQKGD